MCEFNEGKFCISYTSVREQLRVRFMSAAEDLVVIKQIGYQATLTDFRKRIPFEAKWLAITILEAMGGAEFASFFYRDFREQIIAHFNNWSWELTTDQVGKWIHSLAPEELDLFQKSWLAQCGKREAGICWRTTNALR